MDYEHNLFGAFPACSGKVLWCGRTSPDMWLPRCDKKGILQARMVLPTRGIDIDVEKDDAIQSLMEPGCCVREEDFYVVARPDGEVTFVSPRQDKCTCIANSHRHQCICIDAVRRIRWDVNGDDQAEPTDHDVQPHFSPHSSLNQDRQCTPETNDTKVRIQRIADFINSSDYDSFPCKSDVEKAVNQLHRMLFGRFQKRNKQRKIKPLHPYRSATRRKEMNDNHCYSNQGKPLSLKRSTKNDDGRFRKCRRKGSLRSSFEWWFQSHTSGNLV